jgi:hypothetical protein
MPVTDYTPSVKEVAAMLVSRTFRSGTVSQQEGNLVGDFDETTRPTKVQAQALIAQALNEVGPKINEPPAGQEQLPGVYALAKLAVARRAAMLVLVSFFDEDLEQASSGYDELERLYKEALADLENLQADSVGTRKGIVSVPVMSSYEADRCREGGGLLP